MLPCQDIDKPALVDAALEYARFGLAVFPGHNVDHGGLLLLREVELRLTRKAPSGPQVARKGEHRRIDDSRVVASVAGRQRLYRDRKRKSDRSDRCRSSSRWRA